VKLAVSNKDKVTLLAMLDCAAAVAIDGRTSEGHSSEEQRQEYESWIEFHRKVTDILEFRT
jgi:hypothetical protein